jgi:hypothetical protein
MYIGDDHVPYVLRVVISPRNYTFLSQVGQLVPNLVEYRTGKIHASLCLHS